MSNVLSTAVILGVVLHLVSCARGPFQSYVVEDVGRAAPFTFYRVDDVGPSRVGDPPSFGRATGINDAGDVISINVLTHRLSGRVSNVEGWAFSRFTGGDEYSNLVFYKGVSGHDDLYLEGINNIPLSDFQIYYPFTATGGWEDSLSDSPPDPDNDPPLEYHAILTPQNPDSELFELRALRGGRFNGGKDINDAHQVTGWSERCWVGFCTVHAFLLTRTDGMQDLGTLGGNISEGAAINASGQVAGSSSTAAHQSRAFRYTRGVGMVSLGTLSGGDSSRARHQ
jgi:probable HAF family extracellular repeat protein